MKQREFAARRKRLMKRMAPGSVAILATAPEQTRNRDVEFPFRPDSDFFYLTGFPEPQAVAVFAPGREAGEYVLFCRERDHKQEVWHGRRAGIGGAKRHYKAQQALPYGELDKMLAELLEDRRRVYHTLGEDAQLDRQLLAAVKKVRAKSRSGVRAPDEFHSLDPILHEMRLFKAPAEIDNMTRAAEISAEAHAHAMRICKPGMTEYQLEAEFLHRFARAGARSPAYPSIVGGGANACILHYTENSEALRDGDLVLIDAGAEYDGYAADITRTFPVNGRFSAAQRAVYELVLKAQLAAIDQVRPGNSWNAPHEAAVEVITRGLVKLGLLKGKVKTLIKKGKYQRFFLHRTGHWLGMDVHDVGDYKVDGEWRSLQPGMVLTIEPGLYFPVGGRGIPRKYHDIGIRIEDDVLVTLDGPRVLTDGVPKEADAIEAMMAQHD